MRSVAPEPPPSTPPPPAGRAQPSTRTIVLIVLAVVAGAAVLSLVPAILLLRSGEVEHAGPRGAPPEPAHRVTFWYTAAGGTPDSTIQLRYSTGTDDRSASNPAIVPTWRTDVDAPAGGPPLQLSIAVRGAVPRALVVRCGIDVDGYAAAAVRAETGVGVCTAQVPQPAAAVTGPPSAPPFPPAGASAPPPTSAPPGCRFATVPELVGALQTVFGQVMLVSVGQGDADSCRYRVAEYTGGQGELRLTWKPGSKDAPYPGSTRRPDLGGAWHADLGQAGYVQVDAPGGEFVIEFASQLMAGHQPQVAAEILKVAGPRLG